jgi:hypothetical protein
MLIAATFSAVSVAQGLRMLSWLLLRLGSSAIRACMLRCCAYRFVEMGKGESSVSLWKSMPVEGTEDLEFDVDTYLLCMW